MAAATWERRRHEIDEELHLFIIKIAVLSLSSSTRASIFEIASREKSYKTIVTELLKVRELSKEWKVSIPHALRLVSKQTPSRRLSDFLERMAYAMETDEDPKVFFRNEQDAVMEEFKSRYTNTLDRLEVVREVYISMVSVTMFLNVLLVVMSLLVGINHYLMSFLIVFIFLVVEIVLWMVIDGVLPKEHIWYDPKPYPKSSSFHRNLLLWTVISGGASALIASMLLLFPLVWEHTILYLAIASTPLILPGIMVLREQSVIVRRDDAFGAFIRTIGSTSESMGGSASMGLRRLRWHDFGTLTKQVRDLYDRLRLRIDSHKAWALFARESRSELISQFLGTYHERPGPGRQPSLPVAWHQAHRGLAESAHASCPRATRAAAGDRPGSPRTGRREPRSPVGIRRLRVQLAGALHGEEPEQVIAEVRRVLKPGGRFVCVEHVEAPAGSAIQRMQRLLRRPWKLVFEGCDLCPDIGATLRASGFAQVDVQSPVLPTRVTPIPYQITTMCVK